MCIRDSHGAVQLRIHEVIPLTQDAEQQDGRVDRLADGKDHPPVGHQIVSAVHIHRLLERAGDALDIGLDQNQIERAAQGRCV